MALKLALAVALALPAWSLAAPADPAELANKAPAIVGGQEAKLGEFPYIISLSLSGEAWCGGSLLNAKTVLTAAHCVDGQNASDFKVRAGSLHWNTGGKAVGVASIAQHPKYNASALDNDIAILKLSAPIQKGSAISYATLTEQGSDPVPESITTVAGWGTLKYLGDDPKQLMKVSVPVVSRATCKKQYLKDDPPSVVTDNMFCAGLKKGGKDSCNGDSGGPIIDKATGVLIGIVSWGKECALPDFAGVYTRVGKYIPFIAQHLVEA
ncbi:hypothetical protein FDECE_8698 [Fusarium decemcellulare]|nr:hypothetical protein FDECE_8698 [Fusarium decemcellulare]